MNYFFDFRIYLSLAVVVFITVISVVKIYKSFICLSLSRISLVTKLPNELWLKSYVYY